MAKWAEIKCERCDEQDALWEGMERSLEESDAREARLEARIEELKAERDALAVKLETVVKALQAAADDLSGYVGYSYANEYRTILAELTGGKDD